MFIPNLRLDHKGTSYCWRSSFAKGHSLGDDGQREIVVRPGNKENSDTRTELKEWDTCGCTYLTDAPSAGSVWICTLSFSVDGRGGVRRRRDCKPWAAVMDGRCFRQKANGTQQMKHQTKKGNSNATIANTRIVASSSSKTQTTSTNAPSNPPCHNSIAFERSLQIQNDAFHDSISHQPQQNQHASNQNQTQSPLQTTLQNWFLFSKFLSSHIWDAVSHSASS